MAEKGILVATQVGGESVATFDAVFNDDQANARVIQRVDFACEHMAMPATTPVRADIVVADSGLISSFPAEILTNLITCGDNNTLLVWVNFKGATPQPSNLYVTPLWYDNEATPGLVALGAAMKFSFNNWEDNLYDGTGIPSRIYQVNLIGAKRVGIHVPSLYFDGITTADVYAAVVSTREIEEYYET